MDAREFLARVVAPGAFYAFGYQRPGDDVFKHKFFAQSEIDRAVDWLRSTAVDNDVWYTPAAFGQTRRIQANAEALRCFWYDADIARPGDGKPSGSTWQDYAELLRWAWSVRDRLPMPNLWMSSGWGVHLYWVLDRAFPADEWVPYARSFRTLLGQLGARGDIGISTDSARLLRPPETFNYKVVDVPRPCQDLTASQRKLNLPKYYKADEVLTCLTKNSGNVVPLLRPPPTGKKPSPVLLVNAKSNIEKLPPADFATVAERCPQVKKSLDEGGEHDLRPLWQLLVNLAFFCEDRGAAHRIGERHAKYTPADTDYKFAQTGREHEEKPFGPPTCEAIDASRLDICQGCPHWGKIKTPYTLGMGARLEPPPREEGDNNSALYIPSGFKQTTGPKPALLHWVIGKKSAGWVKLLDGEVSNPQLLRTTSGQYHFGFDHEINNEVTHIPQFEAAKLSTVVDKNKAMFNKILLDRHNTTPFTDFLMAWITELRNVGQYTEAPPAFGWVNEGPNYEGLCVGGTYYHADGTETPAQFGDPTIHANYIPRGSLKEWRRAAEFVTAGRPDLQAIVAASLAAPLMEFIGESSILSVWSGRSGAFKTSAFRVGTSIWCNPITGMSAIRDTTNSVQHALGETRIMPVYWDEIHVAGKDQIANMVEMFFNLTQGRGRARLDSRIEQRLVSYWRTMLILSSNKPSAEMIEQDRAHTNAGAVRVFEYQVEPQGKAHPRASQIVQLTERNYGQAGRIYAQWIATHVEWVLDAVEKLKARLFKDIPSIRQEERFHVATMLAIMVAVWIANKLDLMRFDTGDVYKFLKNALFMQRIGRQDLNPVDDEEWLSTRFERFITAQSERLLVCQSFVPRGHPKSGFRTVTPFRSPLFDRTVAVYIGIDNKEMRFDKNTFKTWCRDTGESHTNIEDLMRKQWNVETKVNVLGVGQWKTAGKVPYYVLRLTKPKLEHHLKHDMASEGDEDLKVVPLRPAE